MFNKGDLVYRYDSDVAGYVKEIDESSVYPVRVVFPSISITDTVRYTEDGKITTNDMYPTIVRIPKQDEVAMESLPCPIKGGYITGIANEVGELVEEKNLHYDRAFDKMVDEYGHTYYLSKLEEKLSRIKYLARKDVVHEESIEDSLKDLIGYALLTLNYRRSPYRDTGETIPTALDGESDEALSHYYHREND